MIPIVTHRSRSFVLPFVLVAALVSSACGAGSDSADDDVEPTTPEAASEEAAAPATAPATSTTVTEPDDAEDEDHGDEDHDDHDDEDHGDEDHDDEDHDDHGDEDHDHDHDDAAGGLGAHEHGTAELTVAWIGAEVTIDLVSPTFNVFGFEYEPTTDEDIAIQVDRTAALIAPDAITINDEAGCALVGAAETEVEREGSHSEITATWLYGCDNPDEVSQVDLAGLFAEFPNFEDIDAQWISDTTQSAAELSPSATTLDLQR